MTDRNQPPRFQDHRPSREAGAPRRPAGGPPRRPPQRRSTVERTSSGIGSVFVFLLVGIAAVIAAGVAFMVIAPPTDLIRSQIVAQVKRSTGRDLVIAGPASFTVFPALGVSLTDVTLGAPPQMAGAPLATMDRLDVRLELMPLLTGKLAIDTLVLTNPVFDFRVDKSGMKSWDFAQVSDQPLVRLAQAATGTATDAPSLVPDRARQFLTGSSETASESSGAGTKIAALSELQLGEVRIDNGTLRFSDERRGPLEQVEKVNVALGLRSLADPLDVRGDLTWKDEKVGITATLTSPEAILGNAPAKLVATIESAPMLAGYDGSVSFDDSLALDGALIVESNSLRQLASWLGTALPQAPGFGPMSLQGRLVAAGNSVSLLNSNSSLDGATATGDVTVTTAGARPYIKADLKLSELDLNKYIGSPPPAGAAGSKGHAGQAMARPSGETPQSIEDLLEEPAPQVKGYTARKGWSSEPIDLTLLAAADAEITLAVDRLLFKDIKAGRSRLLVDLQDATMRADLEEVSLYEGTARGIVTINAASVPPFIGANIVIDGISAQPLLSDAAGIDWLSGTGTLSLALAGQGASEREIIEALAGTADLRFVNGAIVGFNIAQTIRGLGQGRLDDLSRVATEKTDFSDLSATFKITHGVAESDDLKMSSPLLRVGGAGKVMLPPRQVDFTVRPKIVANLTGQGGQTGLAGIEIPVRIHGSFHKLEYTPDVGGILKDPDKAAEAVKKLSEQFKGKNTQEIIDGLVGKDENGKKKIDANKLLNNLFGGN